jgi:hypothetical protein
VKRVECRLGRLSQCVSRRRRAGSRFAARSDMWGERNRCARAVAPGR